jgi:hypothetical protein
MKLYPTIIPGCYEVELSPRLDKRGSFVKTFQATAFRELGLETGFLESFYSVSQPNVLRGMHFQLPPSDGAKLVCCLQGEVLDVALDLRVVLLAMRLSNSPLGGPLPSTFRLALRMVSTLARAPLCSSIRSPRNITPRLTQACFGVL